MNNSLLYRTFFLSLLFGGVSVWLHAQGDKYKARVSLEYVKIMNQESYILISAKYKGDEGFEQASDLEFNMYRSVMDDSLVFLGNVKTNAEGKAKFFIEDSKTPLDTTDTYTYVAAIEDNAQFKDTDKSISFSEASLAVDIAMIDSVHTISAVLSDASGDPIPGEYLKIGLQRLFGSLTIGDDRYETDESGSIAVPIVQRMPGIDGHLTFEVTLKESDAYGTVKAQISAPIGIPIEDESSFDERTMWSPPSKTPFYLLLFPNLIILGVWIPLFLLTFNLYRISKSN